MENMNLSNGLQKFIDICMKSLDKFAPWKKKDSKGNKMPFLNKVLFRAHMKRNRLRNGYLNKSSKQNRLSYVKIAYFLRFSFKKNQKRLLCKLECKRYCR